MQLRGLQSPQDRDERVLGRIPMFLSDYNYEICLEEELYSEAEMDV